MTSRIFSRLFFALGVGCMVLPFFGASLVVLLALLVGLALFLFADIPEEKRVFKFTYSDLGFLLTAALLFIELSVTLATTHFHRFGPPALSDQGEVFRFMHSWREIADQRTFFLHQISGVFIGFMVSRFGKRSYLIGFVRGLAWGALMAAAVCICQITGFLPELFDTRGAFWVMVKRYQGTLTDPNAFGMMAAISAPLLIGLGLRRRRLWYYLATLAVVGTGLWSGSRSFFLMLGLTTAFASFKYRHELMGRSPALRRTVLGIFVMGAISVLIASKSELLPVGVARLFRTFDASTSGEMVSSRAIYSQLALTVWEQTSYLTGAGLGLFYALQNAAAELIGIDLRGWADNANNFYLQLLAEGGIVAVLFFFVATLAFITSRAPDSGVLGPILFALALALVTGPHTNFNEVLIVSCVILGFFVVPKPIGAGECALAIRSTVIMFFVMVGAGAYALYGGNSFDGSYGLYAPEGSGPNRFRWSYARAMIPFGSKSGCREKVIRLRSMRPGIESDPQQVRLREYGEGGRVVHEQALRFADNGEFQIELGSEVVAVGLEVTPTWRPFDYGNPGDRRILGIAVRGPIFKSCGT